MSENNSFKLALLIDADNTTSKLIGEIISEAGKYGKVTIRRAYGDFTSEHLKNWKNELNKYAIRPMQKFAYTTGKNSTDSAMIIDAMDIMYSEVVNGFCIASSDSDYTGLALRMREEGLLVLGIGRSNTPEAFQKSCEVFVFTENLTEQDAGEEGAPQRKARKPLRTRPEGSSPASKPLSITLEGKKEQGRVVSRIDKKPINISILNRAVEMALNDEGLAHMSQVKEKIKILDPTFDTRTYGFNSISALFKSMPGRFEIVMKGALPYIKQKAG